MNLNYLSEFIENWQYGLAVGHCILEYTQTWYVDSGKGTATAVNGTLMEYELMLNYDLHGFGFRVEYRHVNIDCEKMLGDEIEVFFIKKIINLSRQYLN